MFRRMACNHFNGSGTCIASEGYTLGGVQVYGF